MKYQTSLRGAENGVFLVSSAPNCGPVPYYMEHFHSNRLIGKGDSIFVCIESNGPSGMYANLARTFVLGDPSDDMLVCDEMFSKARDYHLSLLKPGASCSELIRLHNQFMREHGWPEEDRLFSHGQGYDLVERPGIVPAETMTIKANMNITPHPKAFYRSSSVDGTENWITQENGLPICLNTTPKGIICIK
jgi:Xaa-Pro aminopeptidase